MTTSATHIQAVVVAGDRGASRAVAGQSKAFVEVAGRPMFVWVVETLLDTPEISEVFVVGDAPRLQRALIEHDLVSAAAARGRALHVVPQRRSLYENVWHTFLTARPAGSGEDHPILVVPADVPLIVPEEISEFVNGALATELDYVIGLSPEQALAPFAPGEDRPGIEMAYFNLAEGRYRQNNLHFVRPFKMGNRHYIQDMYENRYQKEWGSMIALIARVLRREFRNLWVVGFYLVLHVAGVLHRRGYVRAADAVRRYAALPTVARGISGLLRTRAGFAFTGFGGAALDVDNADDLEVIDKMIGPWKDAQRKLALGPGGPLE